MRQQVPELTLEAVNHELDTATAMAADIRRAGDDASAVEQELETARMFLEEEDLPPAMEHVSKALALARNMKETEKPLDPQQWKDKLSAVRERVETGREGGLKVAEPAKMLKFSESFALQGNMEVATQYLRKAERLLSDMDARAKVNASKPETVPGPLLCPSCAEEVEPDWVVCAYCNMRLKAEERAVRVAKPVDDEEAALRRTAKVATPVEESGPVRPARGLCPGCGNAVRPHWKLCPSCKAPLDRHIPAFSQNKTQNS